MHASSLRLLLLAVLISGVGPVLVRDSPVSPAATAFWRLATPLPLALWYAGSALQMGARNVIWAILAGVCLAADLVLWNSAILNTSVMEATVLVMLFPILVAAAEIGLFGRRLSRSLLVGGLLAFIGTSIIAFGASRAQSSLAGDFMALGAAFFYAVSLLISGHLCQRNDARGVTFWVMLAAACTTLPIAMTQTLTMPRTFYDLGYLSFYGIITFVGYTLYNKALSKLPASLVAVSGYGQPVIASSLAYLLLGEVPTLTSILGAVVVLGGLLLATTLPKRKSETIVSSAAGP